MTNEPHVEDISLLGGSIIEMRRSDGSTKHLHLGEYQDLRESLQEAKELIDTQNEMIMELRQRVEILEEEYDNKGKENDQ